MRPSLPLFCMLLLTSPVFAFAATIPDAGQLLREQQPQRQMPQQLPKPETEKERPPMVDTGIRITVKGVSFSGYEGIVAQSDLQAVVADVIGKNLTFGELQELTDKVTAWLKREGWFLARAYLPKQDITSGNIEIAIIQGKSDGGLIINRDKSARISDRTVRAIAAGAVSPGQPLHERELERSVLIMNDLPGIAAKASLAQGSQPGSTAVQIDLSEGPLFSGAIWGDNYGNRYTGSWRGNGMLNLNDPLRYGDQLSLLLTGTEGLTQGRAAYSFPLAANGLKANLAYTGMRYELVGDLASLKTEGYSHSVNSGLSYPVLRSRTTNITTTIGYEYKKLVDSAHDIDIRDKQLHSGVIGLNGDKYDTLLGGGLTNWNVGVTTGDMHEAVADISSTGTEGRYTRFNFGVTRVQRVTEGLNLSLSYSGQASLDNLDSSEKFNLGGPSGVRAYPVGEASGDQGHLFNADLRYDLPIPSTFGFLQATAFYDAGQITLHNDPWANSIATATNKNDYWLQGGGAGFHYSNNKFTLKAYWAHTIGINDGRSATDRDADGRNDANRVWMQAMLFF